MAAKAKVLLRSFVQDGMERFTKCDVFLLAYSTNIGGLDKIFLYAYIAECIAKRTHLKQSTSAGMGNF